LWGIAFGVEKKNNIGKNMRRENLKARLSLSLVCFVVLFTGCHNPWMEQILGRGQKSVTETPEESKVYAIGEIGPGGGFVFYRSETPFGEGWHYLEVAPVDVSLLSWSSTIADVIGTETDIGTGRANTNLILDALGTNAQAADACAMYGPPGDWFLPSIYELAEIIYSGVIPKVDYDDQTEKYGYWSSTQGNAQYAYYYDLIDPFYKINTDYKTAVFLVRPIRAF
jgi:hypothetical protein